MNLINWHKRNEEGGLWLAGDENDEDKVRRLRSHSWIEIVDSDEEYDSVEEKSDTGVVVKKDNIGKWLDCVVDAITH